MSILNEYFKNNNVEIVLFPDKTVKKFSDFLQFKKYFENEKSFWEDYDQGQFINIRNYFQGINQNIENAISHVKNFDGVSAEKSLIEAIKLASINKAPCIYSQTPEAKLTTKFYNENRVMADGAYLYLFQNNINNLGNYHSLNGIFEAFLLRKIDKVFLDKLKSEETSLEELRSKYSDSKDELDKLYIDKRNEINTLIKEKDKTLASLQINKEKKLSDLEKLYEEKLRLEGPSKYWGDLYKEYNDKGNSWKNWAIGSSVFFVIYLTLVLYNIPESLKDKIDLSSFSSLKGTIIFTLIASLFIYLIRLFVKLSISSFHLSRDAKERLQLTHVYISLLNDKAVTDKDREIVLQSIFSRSDTGLLKGYSTPAIPGNVLSHIKHLTGK